MATIVGVFSDKENAEKAVRALREQGFEREISVVAKGDEQGGGGGRGDMEAGGEGLGDLASGTTWGGAIGGAAGLLAGAGALAIPGIGPIVAAGPLAAALSGAVAGGVAGGLIDMGIPEEEGKQYEEDIKQGRVLAIVESAQGRMEAAEDTLREHGAEKVKAYEKGAGQ